MPMVMVPMKSLADENCGRYCRFSRFKRFFSDNFYMPSYRIRKAQISLKYYKTRFLIHTIIRKNLFKIGFKDTVVNWALPFLHGMSFEITRTVPSSQHVKLHVQSLQVSI